MVRRPERVLVQAGQNVREEQFELPQELLVARSTRTDRRGNSDLQARLYEACCLITNVTKFPSQISAKTWRRGLGECRMCSLGPSDRLVQQYCLERRTPLLPAVRPRHGAIRVEQNTEVPVHSRNGKFYLVASGKGRSTIDIIFPSRFFSPGISHAISSSRIDDFTRRSAKHFYSHYGSRYKRWNLPRQRESRLGEEIRTMYPRG